MEYREEDLFGKTKSSLVKLGPVASLRDGSPLNPIVVALGVEKWTSAHLAGK